MKTLALLLSIITIVMSSCQKDNSESGVLPNSGKIKRITLDAYGTVTSDFTYNNKGVSKVERTHIVNGDQNTKSVFVVTYDWFDENGQQIVRLLDSFNEGDEVLYYLNSDNLIDSVVRDAYVPGSTEGKLKWIYHYDGLFLTELTEVLYAEGVSSDTSRTFYKHDERGNIIEQRFIKKRYEADTIVETNIRRTFVYDNYPNPFQYFVGVEHYYQFFQEFIYFNANNMIDIKYYENGTFVGDSYRIEYHRNPQDRINRINVVSNDYDYRLQYY